MMSRNVENTSRQNQGPRVLADLRHRVFGRTLGKNHSPGVKTLVILAGLAVCGVIVARPETVLPGLCRWLDVGEAPVCADHVLVLPGDETYRPIVAAAMLKAGWAKDVLIPETDVNADVTDGIKPQTAEVLRRILLHRGISNAKVLCLTGASRTTFEDATALSAYLETRPQDRVIVVTNAFHTRRARFIFRRVLGDDADRLTFVAAPNPGFAEETWWQNRSSANMVLSENVKLGFYLFRYSGPYVWASSLLLVPLLWRRRQRLSCPTPPRPGAGAEKEPREP